MEVHACFINSFSSTPSLSCHTNAQDNPMSALGESVSLGRFMSESESLSWEKWSSFSRNRYVEEAEKYSRPGSVAQKKAYFEAHFKRMAALKAATLLHQSNAADDACETKIEEEVGDPVVHDGGQLCSNLQMGVIDQPRVHKDSEQQGLVVGNREADSFGCKDESSTIVSVKEADSPGVVASSDNLLDIEKFHGRTEPVGSIWGQIQKPPLQARSSNQTSNFNQDVYMKMIKKNPPLSSYMPSVDTPSSSPTKLVGRIHPGKENFATPMRKPKYHEGNDPDKTRTPLRLSINRELNKLLSPVIRKIARSSKASQNCCSTPLRTPAKVSADCAPNPVSATPKSAKRGMLFSSSACGSKPVGPRWHFLSDSGVEFPNASKNKTSSPIIPTSFCLRSGERGGRRKEKLEKKFNAKATTQKFKEKAEAELTKLRGSFCFKAEPASDLYAAPTDVTKSPRQKLHKKGKMPSSTLKTTDHLPPRSVRPALKGKGCKQVQQKSG
ncbi:hypothetical protein Dimus_013545 [Dionaea muscipula]